MSTRDKIISTVAIFISLLALIVSIYQTRILSQEKHANVWPNISIGHSFRNDEFDLTVENSGIGPAIIKDVKFNYRDTSFIRVHHFLKYLINKGKINRTNITYRNIEDRDHVIKPGENIPIITITKDSFSSKNLLKHSDDLDITVDYCSLYNHCWRIINNQRIKL